jgi:hypothetical protein
MQLGEADMVKFDIHDHEQVDWLLEFIIRGSVRPLIVATIYFVTLSALGALVLKAAVTAAIVFVLVLMPLGARVVQGIAVVLLICTVSIWIEIPSRDQVATLVDLVLHR